MKPSAIEAQRIREYKQTPGVPHGAERRQLSREDRIRCSNLTPEQKAARIDRIRAMDRERKRRRAEYMRDKAATAGANHRANCNALGEVSDAQIANGLACLRAATRGLNAAREIAFNARSASALRRAQTGIVKAEAEVEKWKRELGIVVVEVKA